MATSEAQDIGVLFVHGIGDQGRAATLREFGLPLIKSAGEWLGSENVKLGKVWELPDGVPAHAEVTIRSSGHKLRVLTAESWWALAFTPPSYASLLRWLLSTVPFVVQRMVDGGLRRNTSRIDEHRKRAKHSSPVRARGHWLGLVALSSWRLVQNLVALSLAVIVMVMLIVVGLLTFTSGARKRVFAIAGSSDLPELGPLGRLIANRLPRWLRDILIRYIGDSYALLCDDKASEQMVGKVERDLAWLQKCNPGAPVVIIAHSQGAELARRLVSRRATGKPVDSLITFGAGIEKLAAVDRLRKDLGGAWAGFALRFVSAAGALLSAAALLGTIPLLGAVPPWTPVIGLPVAFTALAAARQALKKVVGAEYNAECLKVADGQLTHWLDLYASHDLVSEGSLPVSRFGTSTKIINRRSPLLDHTAYWQNVEAFHAAVALELARVAGWPGVTKQLPARVIAAASSRAKRVWWLVGAHGAIALAALSVATFLARDLGNSIAHQLGVIDRTLEMFMLKGWWPPALACLLVAAVAGGLTLVVSQAWNRWSQKHTNKLLPGRCG